MSESSFARNGRESLPGDVLSSGRLAIGARRLQAMLLRDAEIAFGGES
ncbi:hypothetical protein ACMHYB_18350 [Sorangium sp. So ce1128]